MRKTILALTLAGLASERDHIRLTQSDVIALYTQEVEADSRFWWFHQKRSDSRPDRSSVCRHDKILQFAEGRLRAGYERQVREGTG